MARRRQTPDPPISIKPIPRATTPINPGIATSAPVDGIGLTDDEYDTLGSGFGV
jgi:hypothetical protein